MSSSELTIPGFSYRPVRNLHERQNSAAQVLVISSSFGTGKSLIAARALEAFAHGGVMRNLASPIPGGAAERRPEEVARRVILSLIDREQITLARKTLDALPMGILDDSTIARVRKMLAVPAVKLSSKRDTDRQQDYDWIRTQGQEYQGKWVALNNGQLLSSAASLRELLQTLKQLSLQRRPLLHMIS